MSRPRSRVQLGAQVRHSVCVQCGKEISGDKRTVDKMMGLHMKVSHGVKDPMIMSAGMNIVRQEHMAIDRKPLKEKMRLLADGYNVDENFPIIEKIDYNEINMD